MALNGAELVCVPTNWVPMPGSETQQEPMANVLHKAAAHSNMLAIACADRIGTERNQPFIGQSLIVGPDGWPIAGPASPNREEILVASVPMGGGGGSTNSTMHWETAGRTSTADLMLDFNLSNQGRLK